MKVNRSLYILIFLYIKYSVAIVHETDSLVFKSKMIKMDHFFIIIFLLEMKGKFGVLSVKLKKKFQGG